MSRKTGRNASADAATQLEAIIVPAGNAGRNGISGLAFGALAFSGSVHAADAPPTDKTDKSDSTLQEVVVTGIRASLQKSLDIKENAIGVVDAISAEDIGQFPDSNLAAAIQRVPGVSVSRGTTSMGGVPTSTGDATEITVRGFGPSFNETLIDGRQAASGLGTHGYDSRGFDFSSVGSDFVGEVDVLKTPDAALSSGAIGATINIKYPKPFDSPGMKLAGSASATYSPDEGRTTPNGGVLFSNTFADDTFGILADVSYSKHAVRANHINTQGWEGFQAAPSQLAGAGPGASTTASLNSWFIQDYGIYQEDTTDKRIDGRLVLQWRPSDALLVTVNDDYSKDTVRQDQYGYSVWFNSGSLVNATRGADGTLTSFVQNNTPTDFQGQVNGQVLQNNEFGLNVAWSINSQFKAELDADQSKSRLNPGGQLSSIDADVGYGPSDVKVGTNGANVGIAGVGVGSLPYPTSLGPNGNAAQFINNGLIGSHVLVLQSFQNVDTINQFKLMGTWAEDQTKLRFGLQYTQDTKSLSTYDDFTGNDWQAFSGYGPASNNPSGVALPQSFFNNSFSTSNFISGFGNNGNLPPRVLAFNPYQVLNYLQGLGAAAANPGCCTPPFDGTYRTQLSPGTVQTVRERTYAPFLSLTQVTKLGSMPLTTSIGARYEETYVTTSGLGQQLTALTVQAADHTAFLPVFSPNVETITKESNYRYLLPSLDLNLGVTDEVKVRFDASRTLTRPPLNDITPVLTLPAGERVNSLVANGGNPTLLPFLSDNLDLGVEWYYAQNDYISVDAFLKEVTNFIVGGTARQTINGVIDPTTGLPAQFSVTTQVNGPSAEVRGIEIGVQHMLWDTGFGLQANATFVSTNKPYDPNDVSVSGFAVTGLANSANFVVFYEKYGLHARVAVNHRGEYLDHFLQQQNNSAFGSEPTFVNANTQVDFSSSYDIDRHFSVYFEGLNLNNSTFSTHGRFKEQILDVVDYGPRFTLGARAKF